MIALLTVSDIAVHKTLLLRLIFSKPRIARIFHKSHKTVSEKMNGASTFPVYLSFKAFPRGRWKRLIIFVLTNLSMKTYTAKKTFAKLLKTAPFRIKTD